MNYIDFKNKFLGKPIDFDGAYGQQCFDVYRQYCKDLGFNQSPPSEGAKDIWNNFLKENFIKIPNTPEGVPLQGDVVIWGITIGPYGHVAIFDRGDNTSFTSIDQNWPSDGGKGVLHEVTHTYKGVLGWLRPIIKELTEVTEEQKRILTFIGDSTEGKIREAFGALADKGRLEGENKTLKNLSDDLDSKVKELVEQLAIEQKNGVVWQKELETANKEVNKLQAQLTNLAKEKNQYKNWYEAKCEELKKLDKMTAWQHIRHGINLLIKQSK